MNCVCEKFEGSTTIMCCNKCTLPLKNEPWSIKVSPKADVLLAEEIKVFVEWVGDDYQKFHGKWAKRCENGYGIISEPLYTLDELYRAYVVGLSIIKFDSI